MNRAQRTLVNDGWLFHHGELHRPPARGSAKAGGCAGPSDLTLDELPDNERDRVVAASAEIADVVGDLPPGLGIAPPPQLEGQWSAVELPHDWRISQQPQPTAAPTQGFYPAGVAYYRRRFSSRGWIDDLRTVVEFEGIMRDATVWCNGFLLGNHLSGHTPVRYDLTELLRYDDSGDNVLLVRCDTTTAEGWWYDGAGIYRNVWLTRHPAVHVDVGRVFVWTLSLPRNGPARIGVEVTLRNQTASTVNTLVSNHVEGEHAPPSTVSVPALGTASVATEISIPTPRRWRPGDGQLYTLVTEAGADRVETTFGIRTIDVDPARGFVLNGDPVPIHGANLHQDFAGVGVALPDTIIRHKLELLQGMGCNAVRSAHHPPSPALLDAADQLGMLVIAENRLLSPAPPYLDDLEAMVRGGRNHPSVLAWSLANEETLEDTPRGSRILRRLHQVVRQLDPSRPTTVGGDGIFTNEFRTDYFDGVDVIGTHYRALAETIDHLAAARPGSVVLASEDGLFPTVRGQYEDDEERGWLSSFGTKVGVLGVLDKVRPADAAAGRRADYDIGAVWRTLLEHPRVAGSFVWSGMDYLGEPIPRSWPVTVSSYGAIDICGFPKDYYWLLRSFFRPEPLVHVLPHWTWPGREGQRLRVWAYSNCDRVELVLNGTSLGSRPVRDNIATWDDGVVFQPGTLDAVGYLGDRPAVTSTHVTAGPAARVTLSRRPLGMGSDGHDVVLVDATVEDADGNLCPWADQPITFAVDAGFVLGVGNGDPSSLEPNIAAVRHAFRGRCLAIVRTTGDGAVAVHASSPGLWPGSLSIPAAGPTDG